MKVKQLIELLKNCDPDADIRFAEYRDGQILLWYLDRCCNYEFQEKVKQVWFIRNSLVMD